MKSIKFTKAKFKDVVGSSFYRYLQTSYVELVEKFGEPNDCTQKGEWQSGDQKVRIEWAFHLGGIRKPTVVTIYEYKSDVPIREVTTWHIGCKGNHILVDKFLKTHFADEVITK